MRNLPVCKEALWGEEMQAVLCSCHGDIKQTALLFEFRARSRSEVGRNTAIDDIEHEDGFPFLSF